MIYRNIMRYINTNQIKSFNQINLLDIFDKNIIENNRIVFENINKYLFKDNYLFLNTTIDGDLNWNEFNLNQNKSFNLKSIKILAKFKDFTNIFISNFNTNQVCMIYINLLKIKGIKELHNISIVEIENNIDKIVTKIKNEKFFIDENYKQNMWEFFSYKNLDYENPYNNIILIKFIEQLENLKDDLFLINLFNSKEICFNENVYFKKFIFYLYKMVEKNKNCFSFNLKIILLERSIQYKAVSNKYKESLKNIINNDINNNLDTPEYLIKYFKILILTRNIDRIKFDNYYNYFIKKYTLNNNLGNYCVLYHYWLQSQINIDQKHFIEFLFLINSDNFQIKYYLTNLIPILNYFLCYNIVFQNKNFWNNKKVIIDAINNLNKKINLIIVNNKIKDEIIINKIINYKIFIERTKISNLIRININSTNKISNKFNNEIFFKHDYAKSNPLNDEFNIIIDKIYPGIIKEYRIHNFIIDYYDKQDNLLIELNGNVHFNRNKEILKLNYYNKKLNLLLLNYKLGEINFEKKIDKEIIKDLDLKNIIKKSINDNELFKKNCLEYINWINN